MKTKKLGEVMVEAGLITSDQLAEALQDQKYYGGKLGTVLFERCWISEPDYLARLSVHLGIPAVDFTEYTIPMEVMKLIPRNVAWDHLVVPVGVRRTGEGEEILLAMADPTNLETIAAIKKATGKSVRPVLALEPAIRFVLMDYYDGRYGKGDYRLASRVKPSQCAGEGEFEPSRVREPEPRTIYMGAEEVEEQALEKAEVVESVDSALLSDRLSDERDNFSLELQAFLRLLIDKGLITSEEYLAKFRELKMARFKSRKES